VAVFVDPGAGVEIVRSGDCAGEILEQPRGDLGFGYDPLFLVPALGRTMAELPLPEKNRLSHRAAAFRALAAALGTLTTSAYRRTK
jgi:XTP/dITP diphosphohydrolase